MRKMTNITSLGLCTLLATTTLAVAQSGERMQATNDPMVPADDATHVAYLGPSADVADASLVIEELNGFDEATGWFQLQSQGGAISWTIEYTGDVDIASAAIVCPPEGEGEVAALEDPSEGMGVSVANMEEVVPIDASNFAIAGALEGSFPGIGADIASRINDGMCAVTLSTENTADAFTGRIVRTIPDEGGM